MVYNPFSLNNKTILVTGASSGIGRATAIECSKLGAKVVVTGRNKERLQSTFDLLDGDGHTQISADLITEEEVNLLVEQVPKLDGLVNNAGITDTCLTQFITKIQLDNVLNINTIAPILLTQKLVKEKKISKGGSIVFTSSISGTSVSVAGNTLYSASKGAIHGFMKNAALDLSMKGIRVNDVCPGMIETSILDNSVIDAEMLEKEKNKYPMRRFGKPEEVAYAIIYLLSDASSFVTGSSLVVDGGFTLQ